jgi:hypothetical protein
MSTVEELTAQFIALRNKKKAMEDFAKVKIAPVREEMTAIENQLLKYMNEQGINSEPNDEGTPYKSTRTTAKVVDWEATLAFIQEHQMWHMLYRNVSKEAVEGFIEETGDLPPGVTINSMISVNVKGARK